MKLHWLPLTLSPTHFTYTLVIKVLSGSANIKATHNWDQERLVSSFIRTSYLYIVSQTKELQWL